ncbi:MAG: transposase [Proteobacteria bacterium]|nr:transposase [Pseudomonadota bacterium]
MVKRGRKVADVAERLGVSSHILCRWVKAAQPDDSDARRAALVEARSEILKLRAQLKRTEEERDVLGKGPRGTLPGSPSKVPLHQRSSPPLPHRHAVPRRAGLAQWLLWLAGKAPVRPNARGRAITTTDPQFLRSERQGLRIPEGVPRPA